MSVGIISQKLARKEKNITIFLYKRGYNIYKFLKHFFLIFCYLKYLKVIKTRLAHNFAHIK